MSTDIEQIQTALTEFDKVGAGLAQLKQNYGGVIFEVDTPKGMEHAKAARLALREPRYDVERIRKAAKAPILAVGRHLDSEAARITAEILKLEDPIDQQIKNEEARKEREKQAAIDAETARVAGIRNRISAIQSSVMVPANSTPETILLKHKAVSEIAVDDSFEEFKAEAQSAKDQAMVVLFGLHSAAVVAEVEAARVKAEREELAKLRADEDRRQAAARAEEQAEQARQQEALRKEREAFAAERARQEAADKAERERVAAEQRAESERIAAERRKFAEERQAAELAAQRERTAAQEAERDIILGLVADKFQISTELALAKVRTLFG